MCVWSTAMPADEQVEMNWCSTFDPSRFTRPMPWPWVLVRYTATSADAAAAASRDARDEPCSGHA